jgi:hypothetical protein
MADALFGLLGLVGSKSSRRSSAFPGRNGSSLFRKRDPGKRDLLLLLLLLFK